MRILISGAHGYIGSKLVARLSGSGHSVAAIARRAPSFDATWTRGLELLTWDMTRPYEGKLPTGYDLMIHAAGANDVDSTDPREALLGTALTTRNAAEFCRRAGIARVIYLSTFQVFGRSEGDVSDESPAHCLNDYSLTHWFAEEYLRMAQRSGHLDYIILRPTNVYGAPLDKCIDRWTLVPSIFCKDAFESQTIVLRSSGRQYRNFVHLDSLADTVDFLARNFDRAKGQSYIVAGAEVASIRSVVDQVVAAYANKFGRDCSLVVESDLPKQAAPLRIEATALARLGYLAPRAPTVADEISSIFDLISR